jgi:hypothetical protein
VLLHRARASVRDRIEDYHARAVTP